jgi:hypothetical protein
MGQQPATAAQPQQSGLSPQAAQLLQQQEQYPQPRQPNAIQRGAIVIFPYQFYKNDATPCVIISSVDGVYLKGINLHYLTFMKIKQLLQPNITNAAFSYSNIKYDPYITSAFRSYLVRGIMFEQSRVVDSAFLMRMMSMVNTFDPVQIQAIRSEIERQLNTGYAQPQAAQSAQPAQPAPAPPLQ